MSWIHQWQLSETEKVNKMLGIIKKDITNMAKSHFAITFLVLLLLSLVCDHGFYTEGIKELGKLLRQALNITWRSCIMRRHWDFSI